jgi:aldehyde:ferredoxin oxidoreductase
MQDLNVWRVNLNQKTLHKEAVPTNWETTGGRGLIARISLDEIPPKCNPLSPENKLIFAPGLLTGHMLSSCDRISVGGKSPLTGGIKESNAGGRTGLHMARMGMKAMILEGCLPDERWWILHLSIDGMRLDPADQIASCGIYESGDWLLNEYGQKVAISVIGPGGELGLASAGIQNVDKDGTPSRINARGGLGAVMGSKHLKAIVFDDSGYDNPPIVDLEAFRVAQKKYNKALLAHPQTKTYADYGTAAMTLMCNEYGGLPTRNFSSGRFESAEKISGEHMRDLLRRRGGQAETTHACMVGCTIRCSNVFAGDDGEEIVSPVEYETIGLMGSNLGINNLDTVARMNWMVNDLGLDSIEVGAALGVAAEAGLIEFGDGEGAMYLISQIGKGSRIGILLGNGAVSTGKALGIDRIPAVKGQALSAYDPRAIKGTGVTYATSPQGADHTSGLTIRAKIDHLDPNVQIDASRTAQINMAGYDVLGACIFSGFGFANAPGVIADLLNARYGWDVAPEILQQLGRQSLKWEREFNDLAGFTPADDRLPAWMTKEPLPPHNSVFDVPDEDMDHIFNW